MQNYPTDGVGKEKYSNGEKIGKAFTKGQISTKLKKFSADFYKANDKRKRSNSGRVVFTVFDMCEQQWEIALLLLQ